MKKTTRITIIATRRRVWRVRPVWQGEKAMEAKAMKTTKLNGRIIWLILALILCASWYFTRTSRAGAPPAQTTTPNATIIRTIVYRQITDFQPGSVGDIHNLKISADGSKVIFLTGRKVFTMDATGQNLREIYDAPNPATDRGPDWVDISANGSKVIWAALFAREIFSANADGSNRIPVAPTFQNPFGTETLSLRLNPTLTADGSRIIFTHSGSTADVTGGYRVNTDGTGLTRLFSQRQLAGVFGTDPNAYNNNVLFRNTLAISADGSRLVFGTFNFLGAGNVIAWDSNNGLRRITDFLGGSNESSIALSGDGGRVVVIRRFPDRTSAVAMNFDGGNQTEISRLSGDGPTLGAISANGAQALANISDLSGSPLPLINTDGSGSLDLIVPGDCDVALFRGADSRYTYSLSADGRRFAYRTTPVGLAPQIWVADINPVSTGDAPEVSEVNFNPSYVTANRTTTSTFTLRASGGQGGPRRRTCGASLKNGIRDLRHVAGGAVFGISLYDDGTNGDTAASDGRYTQSQVLNDLALPDAVNPLQIRHNVIANSLRQITAVDATPFFVLSQAPGGAGPRLDSITPASGAPGIQVKLNGSGFDPAAASNIVLFGNRQAVVKTATSDRTMLEVIVPPDLSAGTVPVTVTVTAQTSNAVNFNVTGGVPGLTLNDHRIGAGPIPASCEPPVVKTSFAPTDARAFQWTFVSGFQNGARIRWEWIQPNGSIYRRQEAPVNDTSQHVCFWDAIDIAGQAAASLPGAWQVRVFYNDALLVTDNFTITGGGACGEVSIPTTLTGAAGGALTVPVLVNDLTGKGALSYDATLSFDPNVLRLQSAPVDRAGTISAAMSITLNTGTPGQLRISAFGTAPLAGAGTLLNLKFDVIGVTGSCSALNWTSFRFNEGTPCATTTNGRVCASNPGSLAGLVSYCITPKPVPGVTLAAMGAPAVSRVTGADGAFQLTGLGGGAYTLTPAKTGDVNGVTSFDAALVAQHVVGVNVLNSCQQTAGDTSNNGSLSSFDSALIAQYVVGIANPANFTGTWKFVPPTRTYATLTGALTGQNFDAVLMGDVSGNWSPGAGAAPAPPYFSSPESYLESNPERLNAALAKTAALPSLNAAKGEIITVPVTVGDLSGQNIIACDFDLGFDGALLQPLATPYDAAGTLSSAMTITTNATPGRLRVSAFGTAALSGAGVLLNLKFTVIGAGMTSPLTWRQFVMNEETLAASALTNGRVTVPAANASVSAASYRGTELAANSIVAAFGADLATTVVSASTTPLPETLGGTTVKIRDSLGVERMAPLFFVAPQQVNYLLPASVAPGQATVTITTGAGVVSSGAVRISGIAAGLFAANGDGQGPPAGYAIRVRADGAQIYEAITRIDTAQNRFSLTPLDMGPAGEQVVLVLFGTGFRAVSASTAVSVRIGGVNAETLYAGAQPGFAGLDQLNLIVPRSLAGRGVVDLVLTIDGQTANTVSVAIR
ncbi:MAG: cohesin domain-containing protein [Blastocatellia bacterium]